MTKVKVTVIGYRYVPYKKGLANVIKFQRKVKQSKKVCHA